MDSARTFFDLVQGGSPPLAAALRRALSSLEREHVTTLPRVNGLDGALVARGLYREWLTTRPWAPLLHLDPAHLDPARFGPAVPMQDVDLARLVSVARGGWVYVGQPGEGALDTEVLAAAARAVGARLLLDGGTPVGEVPPALAEALAALDAHHSVATDPTLARARDALLAHCARAETVYLRGAVGSGRRALARWAHAALDDRRLAVVAGGAPPEPGAWWLVPEVGDLDAAALAPLHARLLALESPERAWAPPGRPRRDLGEAFAPIVGNAPALCDVLERAAEVARGATSVLLLGETGAGKEPLAQAIHAASRRKGAFVAVDLASRSATLVDDDLFGHVAGAFDGARTAREGAFRRAQGGTLFLDELGNLPLAVQAKLLRVLERREVQAIGSDQLVPVDVRVIAATNADLEAMVRAGEFRRDLLHRLDGEVLRLPPLRDRGDDILTLAVHFLRAAGHPGELTPEAAQRLRAHGWPGNIRELRKVLAGAARDAGYEPVAPAHLGALAPARARAAPVLVTGEPDALDRAALPRRQLRQLGALAIALDGPAERGAICVRNAILHGLGGRGVTPEALRMLEAHPWWGGFVEMERKLAALRALPPGPITPDRLARCLPELATASGWDPILVFQHPTVVDDQVFGLQTRLAASAIAVGRAGRVSDLGDAPGSGRAAWLEARVGDAGAAFLAFPHLLALSRLHAVVTRLGDGLLVHRAPQAGLEVRAGALGGPVLAVHLDVPVPIGPAGVLTVLRDGAPLVELFLFRGQVALRAAIPLLAARQGSPGATVQERNGARRPIALDAAERLWVTTFLLRFIAGDAAFAPALLDALGAVDAPARLLEQLLTTNRTQSFTRLFAHDGNRALVQEFAAALAASGLSARARDRLPGHVWLAVEGLLESAGEA